MWLLIKLDKVNVHMVCQYSENDMLGPEDSLGFEFEHVELWEFGFKIDKNDKIISFENDKFWDE